MIAWIRKFKRSVVVFTFSVVALAMVTFIRSLEPIPKETKDEIAGRLITLPGGHRIDGGLTLNGKSVTCVRSVFLDSSSCSFVTKNPIEVTVRFTSVPTLTGHAEVLLSVESRGGILYSASQEGIRRSWLRASIKDTFFISFIIAALSASLVKKP